jgi:spore maturation protein SpmA
VLNGIWLALVLGAVVYAGLTGRMQAVTDQIFASARQAVTLVIDLVGIMVFMLGAMRVARDGGLLRWIARRIAPLMRRLFPEVPAEHPAMSAMIMNLAANIFGLGNAATPFGLKAMVELDRLNPIRGVATNSMLLFLCINATAITLMPPTGTVAVRDAAGSTDPFAVWIPTLVATTCSTLAAVLTYYLLRDRPRFAARPLAAGAAPEPAPASPLPEAPDADEVLGTPAAGSAQRWRPILVAGLLGVLALGLLRDADALFGELPADRAFQSLTKAWLFPLLLAGLLLVGIAGRARAYESAIAGAREGLDVAVRIVPYLVMILVAVGMFRASGALDLLIAGVDPVTSRIGIPAEVLPMAFLRPLSGSGAFAVMSEIVTVHGPDSFVGLLACTLQGSTETTFYVLTLYAGAAGVKDLRFALPACLIGDAAGLLGATAACHLLYG